MGFKEDREILREFEQSLLPREGFDDSNYHYCAEYTGCGGIFVSKAKALGWQIIRGDMLENPDMRDEKGECKLGDTVFMRMPREKYERLQEAMRAKNREVQGQLDDDQIKADINEKMSKLLGHNINMSFTFKKPEDLGSRRNG